MRTGADAERVAATQDVDLAIVDLMIDRGAGLQLCEQLSRTVSVLAVSALDQQDRALSAGAQAFIRKPLDPLALVSAVRDLMGTSAIIRSSRRVPQG